MRDDKKSSYCNSTFFEASYGGEKWSLGRTWIDPSKLLAFTSLFSCISDHATTEISYINMDWKRVFVHINRAKSKSLIPNWICSSFNDSCALLCIIENCISMVHTSIRINIDWLPKIWEWGKGSYQTNQSKDTFSANYLKNYSRTSSTWCAVTLLLLLWWWTRGGHARGTAESLAPLQISRYWAC